MLGGLVVPELPEVETICRSIKACEGGRIKNVHFNRSDIIREKTYCPEELCGKILTEVSRRGKYLILWFEGNQLIVHLGMSGRFYRSSDTSELALKHVHFYIETEKGEYLIYYDPRRFGGLWFTTIFPKAIQKLGIEPLGKNFTASILGEKAKNSKKAIKSLLLDQTFIAGLGNIYADETLYQAGIRPDRQAMYISESEWEKITSVIPKILKESIKANGTTFRDYRDGLNNMGAFQNHLNVYGRAGKPCMRCSTILKCVRISGRSSTYCPNCQS